MACMRKQRYNRLFSEQCKVVYLFKYNGVHSRWDKSSDHFILFGSLRLMNRWDKTRTTRERMKCHGKCIHCKIFLCDVCTNRGSWWVLWSTRSARNWMAEHQRYIEKSSCGSIRKEQEDETEKTITVSYTHLDVYKRQLLYCNALFSHF